MRNRHQMRKKRKGLAILNSLLVLACLLAGLVLFLILTNKKSSQLKQTGADINSSQVTSTNSDEMTQTQTTQITWTKADQPITFPILMYHAIHVMGIDEAANAI